MISFGILLRRGNKQAAGCLQPADTLLVLLVVVFLSVGHKAATESNVYIYIYRHMYIHFLFPALLLLFFAF